jgi:hypothetical protein
VITVHFRHCCLEVDYAERYIRTVFEDGTMAAACPNTEESDIARAHQLGYGGDTWQMTLDHEPLHTWVSEMMGEPYSRVLWSQAHYGGERWLLGTRDEEGYVTSVQWHLHGGEPDEVLARMFEGFVMRAKAHTGRSRIDILEAACALLARVRLEGNLIAQRD